MSNLTIKISVLGILFFGFSSLYFAQNFIPADDPNIQYYGRWDFSDPKAPTHSWPGVYIIVDFEGTSIGIRTSDNFDYFNVFIDGQFVNIFQGNLSGINNYSLASGLSDTKHTLLLTKRNETSWTKFAFNGFILDEGKSLLAPADRPSRKIEFIGDSYTSASGNEATVVGTPDNTEMVTNIYEGFGPITARNFDAQYHMTSISGFGMVLDWQSNFSNNLPDNFDRIIIPAASPKWDFEKWVPNLVVITLGLNDYSGFGGWDGNMEQSETELFKSRYHQFISTVRDAYQGVKILAVAAHVEWIQQCVSQVVDEEKAQGYEDIFYTYFPYYDGGYVNNGHPNVATHHKIAQRIISAIDTINAWESYNDVVPPKITNYPTEPFTVYDHSYLLKVRTDSYATMKYSETDKPFDEMENNFSTTGKRDHSVILPVEHNKQYTYYIRGIDINGNAMDTSAVIHFDVDTSKVLINWKSPGYDDTNWKTGKTPIGYGNDQGIVTQTNPVITSYFRKQINVASLTGLTGIAISMKGYHGAVVYLNGHQVGMLNMFEDQEIGYNSYAMGTSSLNKVFVLNSSNGFNYLEEGENTIAIEVHKYEGDAAGISFNSHCFDSKNNVYYSFGSEWSYYDSGNLPENQLHDKLTGTDDNDVGSVGRFSLSDSYPNPFNPSSNIKYEIAAPSHVSLKVYDILGREVRILIDEYKMPGKFEVQFDGSNLSSGLYFYRISAGNFNEVKKMVLLK